MNAEPVHYLIEARNLLPEAQERLDLMRDGAGELPDKGLADAMKHIQAAYDELGSVYQRMRP